MEKKVSSMQFSIERNRKIARYAILLAISLSIWVLEEFVPRPVPWMKPGLSYVAVLVGMSILGPIMGGSIAISRSLLGSLILGKLLSPSFILSISGSVAASIVMILLFPLKNRLLTILGISVAGSFSHIVVQIAIAGALFYRTDIVLALLPVSTIWAVIAGAIVGLIATAVEKNLLKFYK